MKTPNVAGSFYPAQASKLSEIIEGFLQKAPGLDLNSSPWGIIVPHAGYIYSGQTAAYAYKQIKSSHYDTVIILASSHHMPLTQGVVYAEGTWQTPLGQLDIDKHITRELIHQGLASENNKAFEKENSLEVQLPFLQTVLQNFKIVPLLLGEPDTHYCERLGQYLAKLVKHKNILLVASTDMAHYHDARSNDRLDETAIKLIEKNDTAGLYQSHHSGESELCGLAPVLTLMSAGRELDSHPRILQHTNSGEISGDMQQVVGYMSAIYLSKHSTKKEATVTHEEGFNFTLEEKAQLFQLARASIVNRLEHRPIDIPANAKFTRLAAAFVTLHKHGQLRGCIGYIVAKKPLWQTIQDMAQAAAFDDPRFPALQASELSEIDLEISVLTPLQQIKDSKEITIGQHGLYIQKAFHSGLLLPQVATEQGWNREQFLQAVCQKAGISDDAWKKGATIYIFSAEVFGEKSL